MAISLVILFDVFFWLEWGLLGLDSHDKTEEPPELLNKQNEAACNISKVRQSQHSTGTSIQISQQLFTYHDTPKIQIKNQLKNILLGCPLHLFLIK